MTHIENFKRFLRGEKGLMETVDIVLALVMIVIVGAIGIFIADTTLDATGTPTNSVLNTTQNNILSAGSTGSSFVIILIIASIGGIAIAYLFGMLGGRKAR